MYIYIPNVNMIYINKLRHAAKWPMDVTNGTNRPTDRQTDRQTDRLTDCRNC